MRSLQPPTHGPWKGCRARMPAELAVGGHLQDACFPSPDLILQLSNFLLEALDDQVRIKLLIQHHLHHHDTAFCPAAVLNTIRVLPSKLLDACTLL